MFTLSGAQGHYRRVLRAKPLGVIAVLGVLTVALAGSVTHPSTDHIQLVGYGSSGPAPAYADNGSPGISRSVITEAAFGIAGKVTGLFPGSSAPLVLTVKNRQDFAIVVTSIATTVKSAKSSCTAANLSVSAFSGQLSVPAGRTAKITVTTSMAVSAPEGCVGFKFSLVYSGVGSEA